MKKVTTIETLFARQSTSKPKPPSLPKQTTIDSFRQNKPAPSLPSISVQQNAMSSSSPSSQKRESLQYDQEDSPMHPVSSSKNSLQFNSNTREEIIIDDDSIDYYDDKFPHNSLPQQAPPPPPQTPAAKPLPQNNDDDDDFHIGSSDDDNPINGIGEDNDDPLNAFNLFAAPPSATSHSFDLFGPGPTIPPTPSTPLSEFTAPSISSSSGPRPSPVVSKPVASSSYSSASNLYLDDESDQEVEPKKRLRHRTREEESPPVQTISTPAPQKKKSFPAAIESILDDMVPMNQGSKPSPIPRPQHTPILPSRQRQPVITPQPAVVSVRRPVQQQQQQQNRRHEEEEDMIAECPLCGKRVLKEELQLHVDQELEQQTIQRDQEIARQLAEAEEARGGRQQQQQNQEEYFEEEEEEQRRTRSKSNQRTPASASRKPPSMSQRTPSSFSSFSSPSSSVVSNHDVVDLTSDFEGDEEGDGEEGFEFDAGEQEEIDEMIRRSNASSSLSKKEERRLSFDEEDDIEEDSEGDIILDEEETEEEEEEEFREVKKTPVPRGKKMAGRKQPKKTPYVRDMVPEASTATKKRSRSKKEAEEEDLEDVEEGAAKAKKKRAPRKPRTPKEPAEGKAKRRRKSKAGDSDEEGEKQPSNGHWIFANGRRTFVTNDGKRLTGRAAYSAYKGKGSAGGRGGGRTRGSGAKQGKGKYVSNFDGGILPPRPVADDENDDNSGRIRNNNRGAAGRSSSSSSKVKSSIGGYSSNFPGGVLPPRPAASANENPSTPASSSSSARNYGPSSASTPSSASRPPSSAPYSRSSSSTGYSTNFPNGLPPRPAPASPPDETPKKRSSLLVIGSSGPPPPAHLSAPPLPSRDINASSVRPRSRGYAEDSGLEGFDMGTWEGQGYQEHGSNLW